MSCGLTAILYFYLKQKLGVIETRLNTLTDLAQTLAGELYQKEKQQLNQEPAQVNESDESDSESDASDSDSDDSDSDSDKTDSESKSDEYEVISNIIQPVKLELNEVKQIPLNEMVIELEIDPIIVCKKEEVKEPIVKLIEVSDDESSVKQVTVNNEFSQLSLKELKQKVNDLGGPALKTKQALINFLKKKVSE
jgi:hypothetical protein